MTFGYSFQIWVPLLVFPTAGPYGAPQWIKGWPVAFVFYFLLWAGFIVSLVIHRRYDKLSQGSYKESVLTRSKYRDQKKSATVVASESSDDVETIIVDQGEDPKASTKS